MRCCKNKGSLTEAEEDKHKCERTRCQLMGVAFTTSVALMWILKLFGESWKGVWGHFYDHCTKVPKI